MTDRERQILELIRNNPEVSQQELADRLNITRSSVAVHISNLMKKGKIVGKGYIVNDANSVCIVGGVNVDIIATPYQELVDNDSNPGYLKYSFGGVGRNIAENLCRLNTKVEMISVIGDDIYASKLMEDCNALGINVRHSLKVIGENTSSYVCLNDHNGDMRLAINAMDIYQKLTPAYLQTKIDIINRSKVLVIDTNISQEAIAYLCENVNLPIFVDPVSTKKAGKVKPYLNKIYAIKPNLIETELLLDMKINNDEDLSIACDKFLALGIKRIYISLGSRGVYYADEKQRGCMASLAKKIVNTTGCGDAFMAAITYGYLENIDFVETAKLGLMASKICIESEEAVSKEMSLESLKGEK